MICVKILPSFNLFFNNFFQTTIYQEFTNAITYKRLNSNVSFHKKKLKSKIEPEFLSHI